MTRKPLVSVIMPVLNPHPVYFRQAVESILNQTMDDWELIIVEDPSPRSAAEFLKDYPDPRIRYFRNLKRTSLVRQTNRALQEAHGELVACLDQDDLSEPDRLAKQVAFLERHPDIAVVGTWLRVIDEAGRTLGYRCYPCDHEDIVRAMPLYNPIGNPSVMFRRSIVLRHGSYCYERFPGVHDYDRGEEHQITGCLKGHDGGQENALAGGDGVAGKDTPFHGTSLVGPATSVGYGALPKDTNPSILI